MDSTFKWYIGFAVVFFSIMFYAIHDDVTKRHAEESKLAANCKVVGDSYDDGGDSSSMRTIYQCPDGTFHIR